MPTEIGSLGLLGMLLDLTHKTYSVDCISFSLLISLLTFVKHFFATVSFAMEGNSFSGTMPEEVCNLRGESGTLEALSATCTPDLESTAVRAQEVFGKANEFVCRVPDCCTSCELR